MYVIYPREIWSLFFWPNFFAPKLAQNLSWRGPPIPPTIGTYLYIYIYVRTYTICTYIYYVHKWTGVCLQKKWKDVFSTWHVKQCKFNENARKMMWKLTCSSPEDSKQTNPTHPTPSLPCSLTHAVLVS